MRGASRILALAVVAGALAAGACGGPAPPPYKPIADNKLLMNAVIEPAADHIWESAGSIITEQGEEKLEPKNDEEWLAVKNSAVALAESGNLLMMSPRALDGDEWMRLCQALVDTSVTAIRAAERKNVQEIFDIGGEIYAVCTNCHSKYSPGVSRFGE